MSNLILFKGLLGRNAARLRLNAIKKLRPLNVQLEKYLPKGKRNNLSCLEFLIGRLEYKKQMLLTVAQPHGVQAIRSIASIMSRPTSKKKGSFVAW